MNLLVLIKFKNTKKALESFIKDSNAFIMYRGNSNGSNSILDKLFIRSQTPNDKISNVANF